MDAASSKSSNYDIVIDQVTPKFDTICKIWREKMENSRIFLPDEIAGIVPIWIEFIRDRIQNLPTADADEFYAETAVFAAEKLKHFPEHGWKCLIMEHSFEDVKCHESFSLTDELGTPVTNDEESVSPTSSTDSTSDFLTQVDFLLRLVSSSNFRFHLVKTALELSFEPTYIKMESPQIFSVLKKYLSVDPTVEMPKEQTRKDILNGVYDNYILPLNMANEVTDAFFEDLEDEVPP